MKSVHYCTPMKGVLFMRITALLPAIVMAFAFAGCTAPYLEPAETGREEQAADDTEVVSEVPTQEPAAAPSQFNAPLPENPDHIGDCVKDADVLLYLPYGEGDESLGVFGPDEKEERDWYIGPTDFAVVGNKIYILDTYKNRVAVWNGETLVFIPIANPEKNTATHIAIIGDIIYLGYSPSADRTKLISFDMNGNIVEDHGWPEESGSGLAHLFDNDGHPAFFDHDLACFELVDGKFIKKYSVEVDPIGEPEFTAAVDDGRVFTINAGSNTLAGVERIIDNRLYCRGYEFNSQVQYIETETSYRVYDTEGALLGATVAHADETLTIDSAQMYVSPDGAVYIMVCMKDGLYVTRPNLRLEYTSCLPISDND